MAYEILLMRLFSISQWHHFAHMAISLALLGFGASGSVLAVARERLLRRFDIAYIGSLCLFGVGAMVGFGLAGRIRFNPEEVLWDPGQWWGLVLIYLLLALPFFFAASGLGLALVRYRGRVSRVYAFDLVGAGLGGVGVITALYLVSPVEALRLLSIGGVVAAAVAWFELRARFAPLFAVILLSGLVLWVFPAEWFAPRVSEYKSLSQTLRLSGARIAVERSSPLGLLQVVESPSVPLRHAPGMSLSGTREPPPQVGVFTDADNMSAITRWRGDLKELAYLDYLTSALPFEVAQPRRVLVLGSGGGGEVLQARRYRAERIDAVEINPQMLELVVSDYGDFSGDVYAGDGVQSHVSEAREFMAGLDAEVGYDLIALSLTDSMAAASAGLYALNESYLYTVEALTSYLGRLSPEGFIAVTRWLKLPPRDTLKAFATAVDALESLGVAEPGRHLILIRGLQTSTLLVKRTPVTPDEADHVRRFCNERSFDVAWYPGMSAPEANRYNVLQSPVFHDGARALLGDAREAYLSAYKYNLRPATDDRPYFHHFFRWSTLPEVLSLRGRGGTALLDAGYLTLVATLLQALLASVLFILLPLAFLRREGASPARLERTRVLFYYFLIGLAFLFLEIAFIQKFVLFLHHPVYAVTLTLTAFLVSAGAGSALSARFAAVYGERRTVQCAVAAIVLVGSLYLFFLDFVFTAALSAPVGLKMVLAGMLIAPLGLAMGMPFPQALERLGRSNPALVPWAWAINGCASVVSAVLATLLAIHFGFAVVMAASLSLYALSVAFFPAGVSR